MADVGDVDAMGEFGITLLGNEELLQQMKQNAYDQALKFDINNIVPVYEKLYSRFCRMDC
jgi:glycosyltransferase involved in cell wall biosynthesis